MKPKAKKTEPPSLIVDISDLLKAQENKKDKKIVTLYLERESYLELQKACGRKVSEVVSQLIKAYLSAKKGA